MIFMEAKHVGYNSLIKSWLNYYNERNENFNYRRGINLKSVGTNPLLLSTADEGESWNKVEDDEEMSNGKRIVYEDKRLFTLSNKLITYLQGLFDWIIPPCLYYIHSELSQVIAISETSLGRTPALFIYKSL